MTEVQLQPTRAVLTTQGKLSPQHDPFGSAQSSYMPG
jgi:hypothetical protein